MNQEVITAPPSASVQPFSRQVALGSAVNQGAIAVEQERAIAEVQGQLILAKRFPRDVNAAYAELMESCAHPAMAAVAFYSVPNRGSGPSIRLAEEIARVFGNFEFGHRELSRSEGKSEIEVYAWDKQTNNRSIRQLTVMHVQDTKNGTKVLRDQADIDNKIANVASKQVRGRILAMMPKWLVESAVEKCRQTLAGNSDEPISVRVRKMTQAFAKFGVTDKHLATYLGHALDEVVIDELVDLTGIYNAIKEGAKASDYFGKAEEAEQVEQAASRLTKLAADNAAKAAEAKPAVADQNSKPAQKNSKAVKSAPVVNQPEVEAVADEPPVEEVPADEQQPAVEADQPAEAEGDVF